MARHDRNVRASDNDNGDESAMVVMKFLLILFLVILPLEVLLMSMGYTFTPWFFFLFFFSCCRQMADPPSSRNNNQSNTEPRDALQPLPRHVLRRGRARVPTTDEESDVTPTNLDDDTVEPFWTFEEDAATASQTGATRTGEGNKTGISGETKSAEDLEDGRATDAPKDTPGSATKKEFSLLGPSSGRRRVASKKNTNAENSTSQAFRKAVDQARFKTTDVDSQAMAKKNHTIKDDPVDGTYEIEYELVVKDKKDPIVVKSTIDLQFVRGFCGWNIMGSRPAPSTCDNHGYGIVTGDGNFFVQRGFLAKNGNIYWEERGAFVDPISMLVGGKISASSSFSGHWLSSSTTTNGEKLHRGRVAKFARLCNDEENGKDEVTGDIV